MSASASQKNYFPADEPGRENQPEIYIVPNWFAIYTSPRHEKRVGQYLNVREIEHYLPLYSVRRKWNDGSQVTVDLPLFPGYLFVRIDRRERVRVLEVPGVLSFVGGTGRQAASLAEAEIDALRIGLPLRKAEPHPLLTVGQRARIRSGSLAGLEGVVLRLKNSLRIVLTMDLIMQSVSVEVAAAELEPVDANAPKSVRGVAEWPRIHPARIQFGGNERLAWS